MRWTHWLLSLVTPVEDPCPGRKRLRACRPAKRFRPQLEMLEDRHLLSSFLVVLGTDNGGTAGQKVSATSGDLRYCVEQADAAHAATTDAIGFSSKLTTTPHTITLNSANGPLVLSDSHPLTINGPTILTLNISGGNATEVFDITRGTVTLKNLAIIYGSSAYGGGIFNVGTLTLSNCFLDHDSAIGGSIGAGEGGGIFNFFGTLTLTKCTLSFDSALQGGGLWNAGGTATLTNCNVNNDNATSGGGIFNNSGTATLTACNVSSDNATSGGGLFINSGTATLTNCTLSHDLAQPSGGGIFNQGTLTLSNCFLDHDSASNTGLGEGGAIFNAGTLRLTVCTLYLNSAPQGGAIFNNGATATATLSNCNISNDNATSGGGDIAIGGGGIFNNSGTATLTNCILSNDTAANGGGLYNFNGGMATLNNCTLSHDAATYIGGGGIFNYQGTVTLSSCTFSSDFAPYGGGLSNLSQLNLSTATLTNCTLTDDGQGFFGGGIYNGGDQATVTLTNCTLSNNYVSQSGGGIFNVSRGVMTLTNCTLANNQAASGAGFYNDISNTTATLINCTLSNNSASGSGGGIYNDGTLDLTNTIVAGNFAVNPGPDVFNNFGTITADHDLIGDGTNSGIASGGGNIVGTGANPIDPRLGPLQNNGGPTETMALLPDSPAIGMADNTIAPAKDQRGILRIDEAGETTDIGAFEL